MKVDLASGLVNCMDILFISLGQSLSFSSGYLLAYCGGKMLLDFLREKTGYNE